MYVIILGKLSEIHLHARFFSNPCGNALIIDGISWSPDLRVQRTYSSHIKQVLSKSVPNSGRECQKVENRNKKIKIKREKKCVNNNNTPFDAINDIMGVNDFKTNDVNFEMEEKVDDQMEDSGLATDILAKAFEKEVFDVKANGGDIVPRLREPSTEKFNAKTMPSIKLNLVQLSIKQDNKVYFFMMFCKFFPHQQNLSF